MAKTYAKLLSSITASTLWSEPNQTRILWITMLAMADRYGRVEGTVPGLAHMARISVEDTRVGLQRFLSPDEDSNNQAYEGRRIEKIEGGWKLLSYERIRDMRDEEAHRESARKYAARKREEAKNQQLIAVDRGCPSSHLISESKIKIAPSGAKEGHQEKEPRPRDELWEALLQACGIPLTAPLSISARGAYNRAVKSLRAMQVEPPAIYAHAQAFRQRWPQVTLTPTALERRWNECVAPPRSLSHAV